MRALRRAEPTLPLAWKRDAAMTMDFRPTPRERKALERLLAHMIEQRDHLNGFIAVTLDCMSDEEKREVARRLHGHGRVSYRSRAQQQRQAVKDSCRGLEGQ